MKTGIKLNVIKKKFRDEETEKIYEKDKKISSSPRKKIKLSPELKAKQQTDVPIEDSKNNNDLEIRSTNLNNPKNFLKFSYD